MSIKEREEFLFQKLREKDASIVADGVICEQEFLNARYKIVYILKEVNGGKSWDLRDFVYEGGRPQTWDNIARWTEGILSWEKEFPWSEMEIDNEQRRLRELKKIAAVNLKKTSGGHTSNNGEIYRAAVDHHDIIKEQIDLYKADFIICCGTEYAFMDACYKDREVDWKMTSRGIWYFRDGKSAVISFSHPEARVKDVNRQGLQEIVNEVFYSKWLTGNYFTPEDEMSIDGELKRILIWSREAVFAWLYKGREVGMDRILHTVARNVIKESIKNGYMGKVVQQFNLMCSFDEYFGGCNMADRYSEIREKLRDKINCRGEQIIESDEEYFYAVGQLVRYYISLSKAKEKTHSLANPFFNATSNEVLQTRLKQYFMKYNHEIATRSSRFNYMYGMVLGYELEGKIRQEPIIAGYLSNSLFYESSKKEMEET